MFSVCYSIFSPVSDVASQVTPQQTGWAVHQTDVQPCSWHHRHSPLQIWLKVVYLHGRQSNASGTEKNDKTRYYANLVIFSDRARSAIKISFSIRCNFEYEYRTTVWCTSFKDEFSANPTPHQYWNLIYLQLSHNLPYWPYSRFQNTFVLR